MFSVNPKHMNRVDFGNDDGNDDWTLSQADQEGGAGVGVFDSHSAYIIVKPFNCIVAKFGMGCFIGIHKE